MILTCPKCASRFNLLASILAPEGKRVKCSNCGETWHQLPDPDELLAEIEMQDNEDAPPPFDDIPESVKPIPEGSSVPALTDNDDEPQKQSANIVVMLLSALLIFILLCAPIIVLKGTIIKVWPESIAFYKAIGMDVDVSGEGIVFDQMRGELSEGIFALNGQIINLTASDSVLPVIEVTLQDEMGEIISFHYIRPPKDKLNAEEILPISAQYAIEDARQINSASARFVLKPKTALEGDDNTPAPHADESHPPPDVEASPKSPAHVDAPPHRESPPDSRADHH